MSGEWKPIDTAPKDRRILLLIPMVDDPLVVCGQWNRDSYKNKPRPHWENDQSYLRGALWTRAAQPTHWMELP